MVFFFVDVKFLFGVQYQRGVVENEVFWWYVGELFVEDVIEKVVLQSIVFWVVVQRSKE